MIFEYDYHKNTHINRGWRHISALVNFVGVLKLVKVQSSFYLLTQYQGDIDVARLKECVNILLHFAVFCRGVVDTRRFDIL